MMDSLNIIASFAWATCGFLCLALTINRHYYDVFGTSRPPLRQSRFIGLQLLGWSSLLLSLTCAVLYKGWAVGATAWMGVITVIAFLLMLLLTYKPNWAVSSGIASALIGAICISAYWF